MAHERIKPEFLFDEEKINQLKQIAPECFEDGKLNFETLRQNLGDWAQDEEDGELEHFGLFWPGKKDARRLATIPPEGTLEPVYGEGLKADGTSDDDGINDSKNIFIEGENLEVLKILQKSYSNKIKMIYIDPPYNTGNDFVYDDNFTEPLQEYLRRTGQIDEEGKSLTTNKKSDGRFHSKWLSMIFSRLRLTNSLLREDGVIFVSIGQEEVANLRLVLNEVFGEENYITTITRLAKTGGAKGTFFTPNTDFILVYAKNIQNAEPFRSKISTAQINTYYKFIQKDGDRKGERYGEERLFKSSLDARANQRYYIECPDGSFIIPPGETFPSELKNGSKITPQPNDKVWKWTFDRYKTEFDLGNIVFKETTTSGLVDSNNKKTKYNIYNKLWLKEQQKKGKVPANYIENFENRKSSAELKKLNVPFDYAKPTGLIKYLIEIAGVKGNDIILDFFAGSCSTGDAIYQYNKENKEDVKFICVQLPEIPDEKSEAFKLGYRKISDVSRLRLKKSIEAIPEYSNGFRTFKLVYSNYKKWNDIQEENISKLENSLDLFNSSPLREDWNKNKLISELILLEGFPLDASLTELNISSNKIVRIESKIVPNTLLICVDDEIEENLINELKLDNTTTFICLDSAISNQNKLRLSDKGLIKTI